MKQLNMITKKIRFAITAFFIFIPLFAQDLINSGPMVGYSTMQEVLLWVQTSENAKVHFEYYEIDNPSIRFKTDEKITEKKTAFVAKLIADQVMPGKKYIKIVQDTGVFCFIVKEDFKQFKKGDILKAAGYNAPALNSARGNVLTGNYNIQLTGPLYLK